MSPTLGVVAPAGCLDDLRSDLVEHKAEVLALLAGDPFATTAPPWPELAVLRWGPSLEHDLPGLDVHPDRPLRPI